MNNEQENRIKYIISMYQKLLPEETITGESVIRGTTIFKLCEFAGPGYYRVEKWLKDKTKIKEGVVQNDMNLAKEEFQKCFSLMKSRNQKYGQSWKVLSIQSIANLIEMKMNRIAKLGEIEPKTEDELIDTANYAIFALIKLRKQND